MSAETEYITCEELLTFLYQYLNRELSAEKAREFERHLAVCPMCVSYMKTYEETIQLGKGAYEDDADPAAEDMPPELVAAILAARKA